MPLSLRLAIASLMLAGLSLRAPQAHGKAVEKTEFTPVTETELGAALQKYRKISQLNVQFKQTKTLKDMDMPLESQGDLQIKLPDEVIYQITKPSPLKVTMTPQTIQFETGTGPTATKQTIQTSAMPADAEKRSLQAMVTWFKMDPAALIKQYEITSSHDGNFRFRPREAAASPFQKLDLVLAPTGHVGKMTMEEKSGDRIDFVFETPKIVYAPKVK